MNEKYYLKTKNITKDEQKENKLSFGNFLDYFHINLTPYNLKNSNIDDLSYEFIQNYDKDIILEFFENHYDYLNLDNYDLADLKNLDTTKLNKLLQDNYYDFVFECYEEYYQYFIINENDLCLFKECCNYDILYDHEKDLYILCIDHLGMSWYMIDTKYSLDNLNQNYLFENIKDTYQLFEKR